MLENSSPVKLCKLWVAAAAATTLCGCALEAVGATYSNNVTNVSAAVTAAGASTANIVFGSASISSDGRYVAGFTSANNPFLYTASAGTANVLSSVTGYTVAVNSSGTLVSGYNLSATTPNSVYRGGSLSSIAATSISGQQPGATSDAYVSLTGINNAGTTAGYLQYTPASSSRSFEGIVANSTTLTGQDVGSGFSGVVSAQTAGNVLYSVNDSGVGAGYGVPIGASTRAIYTATPNGSGGYTYRSLSPQLAAASTGGTIANPSYVGIDSHGDVAGSFTPSTLVDGFLYDSTADKAYDITAGTGGATTVNGLAYVNGIATVVGNYHIRGGSDTAYVFTVAGGYQTLAAYLGTVAAGYTLTSGLAIDPKGDILAVGSTGGVTGTYLFTAVPEPTSVASLAVLGVAALRRRRVTV